MKTLINPYIYEDGVPFVSPAAGDILQGGYEIGGILEESGQSVLFAAQKDGQKYAVKILKTIDEPDKNVLDRLHAIDSSVFIKPVFRGRVNGFPFQVCEYQEGGSLSGRKLTAAQLVETVIPSINEALALLHNAGIVHRDVKPANMLFRKNGKAALSDFGASISVKSGQASAAPDAPYTPEYAAPEIFAGAAVAESDYYAFGISIFELFCGYNPYAGMSPSEIAGIVAVMKPALPVDMPQPLQNLIKALTWPDISVQSGKNGPNRRWTYEEVVKWLCGESLPIPGETSDIAEDIAAELPPFAFASQTICSRQQLIRSLAMDWNAGKQVLYSGKLGLYFDTFDAASAAVCRDANEVASAGRGDEDRIFFEFLYSLNALSSFTSRERSFYWKNAVFESLPALGRCALEGLWNKDKVMTDLFGEILSGGILTVYIEKILPDSSDLAASVRSVEAMYAADAKDKENALRDMYLAAYILSGQKILAAGGESFHTTAQFTEYLNKALADSFEVFRTRCRLFTDARGNLDSQLEAWLMAMGKNEELAVFENLMNRGKPAR